MLQKYESLLDTLQIFEKMYEIMRIVDPISKRVLEVRENELFNWLPYRYHRIEKVRRAVKAACV